jgi:hypothetical protein
MGSVEKTCACGNKFMAKIADIKRGWAKSCSKSCAAKNREKRTGTYAKLMQSKNRLDGYYCGGEFYDAHLFSNEDHCCNK